jgi:hypothetical protein
VTTETFFRVFILRTGGYSLKFPERVYTEKEVRTARELINKGYKHSIITEGSSKFEQKVNEALELVKTAGYYEFLRTYIKKIVEIDGLTQLRETEAVMWANKFAVENPVDAASLLIQKANHMKEYLEGELYYGGNAEQRSVEKRIKFLEVLEEKSLDESVKEECARLLQMWDDSSTVF